MSSHLVFHHPCTIHISGPTGSGKTRFVRRVLEEQLIQPFPTRIIWVFSEWQEEYDRIRVLFPTTEFVRGYCDELYDALNPTDRNLLVLDDQMSEAGDAKSLVRLFTKGSHHRNLTIIYLVQNLFDQGKSSRTVSLNSQYNVVFRNLRDASQFSSLARQVMPDNSPWLHDAFADATREPYGYLVIDNHPQADSEYRFRTRIFSDEQPLFYTERKATSLYKLHRTSTLHDLSNQWENPRATGSKKN